MDAAEELRQRANELRRFALRVADNEALSLAPRSGAHTWLGPTANACSDELWHLRESLLRAAGGLRASAFDLDQRADILAAQAIRLITAVSR